MKTAIVLAAGTSSRTNLNMSKILYKIKDKEVFRYSLDTFIEAGYQVILVVSKDILNIAKRIVPNNVLVVEGGSSRCESTKIGLSHVTSKYVMIHDAARPLVTHKNIEHLEDGLKHNEAVFLASKMVDSLKSYKDGDVSSINREEVLIAETPQCFLTEKIKQAHDNTRVEYSDDISLYQAYFNKQVLPILNDTPNIKVTYDKDIEYIKFLLNDYDGMRIGHSYDIHQLVKGRKLILGGVNIPFDLGLLGHSDADCLIHAITESILGALGLGDLGKHFPDDDAKYKDIASTELLQIVCGKMDDEGYEISNIDSIIFAQNPKMAPHIESMKNCIASILAVDTSLINIKATTYEKMDSIGRGEAIACESICLLRQKTRGEIK